MQNLVAVSLSLCAHVGGPKFGRCVPEIPNLASVWLTLETC